jgi:hypothetical protein
MNIINWIMKLDRSCGSVSISKLIIVTGKVIRNVNVVSIKHLSHKQNKQTVSSESTYKQNDNNGTIRFRII